MIGWGMLVALIVLGFLSVPQVYDKVAGLEHGKKPSEVTLRALQCVVAFSLAIAVWSRYTLFQIHTPASYAIIVFISIVSLEVATRVFFKQVVPSFEASSPIHRLEKMIWDQSSSLGEYFWVEQHPFLQFTRQRGFTSDGDYALGFIDIMFSDIPRPEGVVRVACLGNSTTTDGYPEQMENYLNSCTDPQRFQVLNFGLEWWTSIHTMLNFVLNVREFHPDFIIVHENCNDEKYRGYPGFRWDGAHAIRTFTFKPHRDEWLYRFSLLYRLGLILIGPFSSRKYYQPTVSIGMRKGKTLHYIAEELQLFRRNIQTICTLAASEGIKVILATMPFSTVLRYTEFDEVRFDPHLRDANEILRHLAAENQLKVVDLERRFAGRDQLFLDKFHLTSDGAQLKALEIGKAVFSSIGIHPTADEHWRTLEARSA